MTDNTKRNRETEQAAAQEAVITLFEGIHPVSPELRAAIIKNTQWRQFKRKHRLLDTGKVQQSIYFIMQGAIRSFYLDSHGKESTSWLLFEGDLAISVYSFFGRQPSFEVLETLEDTSLLVLSYDALMRLYGQFPEFNYIGRMLTERYYIRSEEKANELRVYTAKRRYQRLMSRRPDVLKRIPLGIISSYLGITPSTLSRIRGNKNA